MVWNDVKVMFFLKFIDAVSVSQSAPDLEETFAEREKCDSPLSSSDRESAALQRFT